VHSTVKSRQLIAAGTVATEHRNKIRVVLVDDHPQVREGLAKLIASQPDLLVVGEAGTDQEATTMVAAVAADVALVDVSMPGMSGVKLTEVILSIVPTLRVIGVTRHNDRAFVAGMLAAGAWGYVLKQSPSDELLRAIRAVAGGQRFIDPTVQGEGTTGNRVSGVGSETTGAHEPLTALEEQVMRLVAAAHSNQDIAARLNLPAGDVAALKSSSMKKAGLVSRLQVILYAEARGWE
jgi:DNA-binding NarL/FixJ family response regulator